MEHSKREDEDSLTSLRSENYKDAQEELEEQMSFSSRFDAIEDKLRTIEDKFRKEIEDKFTRMTEDKNINLRNDIQGIKNEISKTITASFEDINTSSPHRASSCLHELGRSDSRIDAMEDKLRMIEDKFMKETEDKFTRMTEDLNINLRNEIKGIKNQISKKRIASDGYEDINTTSPNHSYFHELFNSISLPGLRYVDSCEPTLHRLLWILIHTVAFLISHAYIKDAYEDWRSSPIIHSLAMTKVKDIPFPAITICKFLELREDYNQSGYFETCVKKKVNDSRLCNKEESKMFSAANDITPFYIPELGGYFRWIDTWNRSEYLKYIDKVVKPVVNEEVLTSSDDIFDEQPVVTIMEVEGVLSRCRTFNNINLRFSSPKIKDMNENIQHHEFKISSVCTPDKILEYDCKNDLFYSDKKVTFLSVGPVLPFVDNLRFRIFFHSPADYPMPKDYDVYRFPVEKDLSFYITPNLINAKKDLIQVDVSERNCLYSFEKRLSQFEFYTRKNCLIDCKIRCMMDKCGCITRDFSVHNSSLPICGGMKGCGYIIILNYCTCNCPEDCISLTFRVKQETNVGGSNRISVRYEKPEFISSYRYSATSPGEFLAYALGMLGVFNGFSFMLVWEVLYWLTLRLWSTIKRYPHFQSRG